ncbi:MAG: Na+/H+ antiporter NhaC family protein [Acidobacteriota bacterium]
MVPGRRALHLFLLLSFFLLVGGAGAVAGASAPAEIGGVNAAVEASGADVAPGSTAVAGEAAGQAEEPAPDYGWRSLVPPLLAIFLALLFRDVVVAIYLGIFSGALIVAQWDVFAAFGRSVDAYLVPAIADGDHAAILMFTTLLGAMIGLVSRSGGTRGIVEALRPWATSPRRGQTATVAMGTTVFFDDYANTLIVGPTMRPITDRLRVSREKLAYLVDSTAAPVVCLVPISTWVGFELGLIGDALERLELPFEAYGLFLQTIPYRFYPLLALVLVATIALSGRDRGPMLAAERRARRTGKVLADDARPIADYGASELEPPPEAPKRALNALVPIATVVLVTLLGLWRTGTTGLAESGTDASGLRAIFLYADSYKALLWASLAGTAVALVLPVLQRILTLGEAVAGAIAGMKSMFMALLVLTLAWSLSAVCSDLGTAAYLVEIGSQAVAPQLLPALTFVLAAVIAFATGSSWGTMGILEPLIVPFAHTLLLQSGHAIGDSTYMAVLLGSVASVLAGAVWGDHCSPISDTTVLSSMASGCDHIAHVRTQLPYALSVGLAAIVICSVPAGYGASPWLLLLVAASLLVGGALWLGRRADDAPAAAEPPGGSASSAAEAVTPR